MKQIYGSKSCMLSEPANTGQFDERQLAESAGKNRLEVIESALTLELILEDVITYYFFPKCLEKAERFRATILTTDWCSFAAKQKLISHIVSDYELLSGEPKNEFEKIIGKAGTYRNAFAHGKLRIDGNAKVWLSYFKQKRQEVELTDDYLTQVEKDLKTAVDTAFDLFQKLLAHPAN